MMVFMKLSHSFALQPQLPDVLLHLEDLFVCEQTRSRGREVGDGFRVSGAGWAARQVRTPCQSSERKLPS